LEKKVLLVTVLVALMNDEIKSTRLI